MEPGSGDQRVTLALVCQKVDALADDVREFIVEEKENGKERDRRLNIIENCQASQEKEIENLSARVNSWSLINSLGAVGAMILGFFGINK